MRLLAIALCVACAAEESSTAAPKEREAQERPTGMTRDEARALAEAEMRRTYGDGAVVIVDDLTQEHDFGWVFFCNGETWARTRKPNDAIPGAGAILVDRDTRVVKVGGGRPPDLLITEHRKQRSTGVAAKTTTTTRANAAPVSVTVTTATPSSELGDVVTVTVEIANASKRAVGVDGRLAVGDTLTFEVRGDDGKPRPITRVEKKGRDPRELAAGATLSTWVDLSHHLDLDAIGAYTVIARVDAPDGSWSATSAPLSLTRKTRISAAVPHDGLYAAFAELPRARQAIREERWADAVASARIGLQRLGSRWLPRHAADTTTKEIEDAWKAWAKDDPTAAERLVSAMERRAVAYAERHHHPNLAQAKTLLAAAEKAAKPKDALVYARRAIDLLGMRYAPHDVIDDTGLKLAAAEDLEAKGRIADAASTTVRMLDERISLYERRWKDSL